MDGHESLPLHLDGSCAFVERDFVKILFQHGALQSEGKNGCKVEDVVDVLIDKLLDFQGRSMACEENDQAIYHLTQAKSILELRRARREQQGVIGTTVPHKNNP